MKQSGILSTLAESSLLPWVALAVIMTAIQAIPDAASWLRYDRVAISNGELWRLLTANFIHLGWGHLALNVAGLLVIGWLFAADYSVVRWALILLICAITTSVGLYFLSPQISWCVGLSGALHGLFAAGAIAWIFAGDSFGKWVLAGGAAKLVYEQLMGSMPLSAEVVGGAVVTEAHVWGAAGGVMAALVLRQWRRDNPRL